MPYLCHVRDVALGEQTRTLRCDGGIAHEQAGATLATHRLRHDADRQGVAGWVKDLTSASDESGRVSPTCSRPPPLSARVRLTRTGCAGTAASVVDQADAEGDDRGGGTVDGEGERGGGPDRDSYLIDNAIQRRFVAVGPSQMSR